MSIVIDGVDTDHPYDMPCMIWLQCQQIGCLEDGKILLWATFNYNQNMNDELYNRYKSLVLTVILIYHVFLTGSKIFFYILDILLG